MTTTEPTVSRATHRGHGKPARFTYHGYGSMPWATGEVVEVRGVSKLGIGVYRCSDSAFMARLSNAQKFWASMP